MTMLVFFPSVVTAFSIMAALEAAGRAKGGRGLLGWIPKLPWGNPSVTAQLLAMFVFLFGGITGLINASYTVNQVVHNTAFIPGHFHMTVGTAVALTIMGVAYWLVPYLTGHALFAPRLALLQSWLYAIGVLVFARGQIAGGLAGQPRRTAIGQAAYELPSWALDNWLTAIGGVLMTISGALFFIVIIGTIIRNVPTRVEIPVAEAVISSKESWGILDRLGFWMVLGVGLIVIAYAPTFLSLMPANLSAPGWNTIWGPPVTVPNVQPILPVLFVLAVVGIFVWFWRLLQSYVD
jgi:cytochrome c oxidase subunit 1